MHLVAAVERSIAGGRLEPGASLPSVRTAAMVLGLAPNTVASAYRKLRERGIVVGRGRQGTVVAGRPSILRLPVAPLPSGIVDAVAGNPDRRLLPSLAGPLALAASAPAHYGDVLVLPELGAAARRWLAADGIEGEHVTLTAGAMDAIERLLVEQLRIGDRVAVEDPGHRPVHELVAAMGLEPFAVPIDQAGMEPDALRTAIEGGARAVVLTPRAQNPTGAALTGARVGEINAVLADHPDVFVIEDDHAGPAAGVELVGLDRDRQHWAVVRSVSKTLGPDLRLAFIAGDRDTVERVEARLSIGPGWISHIIQRAVAVLLDDPDTHVLIGRAADSYRARRLHLIDRLAEGGIAAEGGSGLHVWIAVPDEQRVVDAARDAGFAIRAGASYRIGAPPAVRVTVAALDDVQLDQVAAAIVGALDSRSATSRPV